MNSMKLIQDRAKIIKANDSEIKHRDAVKLAAKQLRDEGVFGQPRQKRTRKPKNSVIDVEALRNHLME